QRQHQRERSPQDRSAQRHRPVQARPRRNHHRRTRHPSSRGISGIITTSSSGRDTAMTAKAIDLHEELAEAKVGKFHWRLGAIMGLLTLFDGYDTFNPAYVIHYVAKPWVLQAGQAGLLISSGLVGFLIGAA